MPFTFSHPALVLPLFWFKKRFFSKTGLIAGSIMPDFEYFIRMKKGVSYYSHTIPGLFLFNLPLALLLIFIFHAVVRKPLVHHLPLHFFKRLYKYEVFDWKTYFKAKWVVVIFSILLGAVLHLLWDRFTHVSADYLYERQHIVFIFSSWQHHSIIYLLVHLTHSLIGAFFLALTFFRLPENGAAMQQRSVTRYWITVSILAMVVFIIRLLLSVDLSVEDTLVSLIAAFLLAVTIASLLANKNKMNYSS